MQKMRVTTKLFVSFTAVSGLAVLLGVCYWVSVRQLSSQLHTAVHDDAKQLEHAGVLAAAVCDMLSIEREMALQTMNVGAVEQTLQGEFDEKLAAAQSSLAQLISLADNDGDRGTLARVEQNLREWQTVDSRLQAQLRNRNMAEVTHTLSSSLDQLEKSTEAVMDQINGPCHNRPTCAKVTEGGTRFRRCRGRANARVARGLPRPRFRLTRVPWDKDTGHQLRSSV